jgi:uncharacterized membrane protein YfcA
MMIVDMIVTLIVAVLSGMGIGSGGLMVLYLTLFRDSSQLAAQGLNLLFFLFAAASSMLVHLSRRHIRFGAVLLMIAGGLPAAYLGTRLALALPDVWVRRIFGVFLIIVGLPGVLGSNSNEKRKKKPKKY